MLRKILKHEFKATYRYFVPIYIVLAALTGFGCIIYPLFDKYENVLAVIGFGLTMLAIVLGYFFIFMSPYIFLSMRFYQTTATREAYLTFTIPADTKTILFGKYLNALFWSVMTSALCYLSFFVFTCFTGNMKDAFEIDNDLVLALLSILLSMSLAILTIFTAISLSQLVHEHRVLASLGFSAALYTIQQIVSVVVMLPIMFTRIESAVELSDNSFASGMQYSGSSDEHLTFLISFAISIIFSVAYFLISNYMLKKKLNLL